MKRAIAMFAVALVLVASSISTAQADLIFLEEFHMVGERTSLMITFQGPPDSAGRITMELKFGEGLSGKVSQGQFPAIRDPKAFRSAMEKLLKALNNPTNVYINLQEAMKSAGWGS